MILVLALRTAPAAAHPMLDAITNWVKKAGATKLGKDVSTHNSGFRDTAVSECCAWQS